MAISVVRPPPALAPAYRPVEWIFSSSRYPVSTLAGESAVPIFGINVADAAAIALNPGLELGDVFILFAAPATGFPQGSTVRVFGALPYDGDHRVLRAVDDFVRVIDAAPQGQVLGGAGTRIYQRFRLVADVQFLGGPTQRYYIDAAPDNTFTLDVRNQAQRSFADVFDICFPGVQGPAIQQAHGYVTNGYSLTLYEAWQQGAEYIIEDKSPFIPVPGFGSLVVNAVQPYTHYNEWDGEVDLNYNEVLADYVITNTTQRPFLTYAPYFDGDILALEGLRFQTVATGDDHFLAFLADRGGFLRVELAFYNEAGTPIGVSNEQQSYPAISGIIPCGPNNLTLPAGTAYYTVGLRSTVDNSRISERYGFRVDPKCHRSPRRFYALNKFGGIDAFTFTGYESRDTDHAPELVERQVVPTSFGPSGSFRRRMWKNEPLRRRAITTGTLPKAWLRYVADEILESPDIRIIVDPTIGYTPVVNMTPTVAMGFEHGRLRFEHAYGVDNMVQRR